MEAEDVGKYKEAQEMLSEQIREDWEDLIENYGEELIEKYIEEGRDDDPSTFEESYYGEFASDVEFTRELLENTGDLPELPAYIHIDWESTAKDIMFDYMEIDGHYFRYI